MDKFCKHNIVIYRKKGDFIPSGPYAFMREKQVAALVILFAAFCFIGGWIAGSCF